MNDRIGNLRYEMADKFCATQKQIFEDGEKTREMLRAQETQALRDKIAALTLEVSQNKQDASFAAMLKNYLGCGCGCNN